MHSRTISTNAQHSSHVVTVRSQVGNLGRATSLCKRLGRGHVIVHPRLVDVGHVADVEILVLGPESSVELVSLLLQLRSFFLRIS